MGIGKFKPPTKSIPLNKSTKKFGIVDYVREGTPVPNLIQIYPLRASGKMGEI